MTPSESDADRLLGPLLDALSRPHEATLGSSYGADATAADIQGARELCDAAWHDLVREHGKAYAPGDATSAQPLAGLALASSFVGA